MKGAAAGNSADVAGPTMPRRRLTLVTLHAETGTSYAGTSVLTNLRALGQMYSLGRGQARNEACSTWQFCYQVAFRMPLPAVGLLTICKAASSL